MLFHTFLECTSKVAYFSFTVGLNLVAVIWAKLIFIIYFFDLGKTRYSGLCRMAQKLVNILKQMDPRNPYRIEMTDALLEKL